MVSENNHSFNLHKTKQSGEETKLDCANESIMSKKELAEWMGRKDRCLTMLRSAQILL
jgi:hypothetical protein